MHPGLAEFTGVGARARATLAGARTNGAIDRSVAVKRPSAARSESRSTTVAVIAQHHAAAEANHGREHVRLERPAVERLCRDDGHYEPARTGSRRSSAWSTQRALAVAR
jgi:hypothetical protein